MSDSPSSHAIPFDVPTVEEMTALLPQYEFDKLAAFGGMGAVYKARQASLDRPVAVKILPPAFGAEPEFGERFTSEARAMAKLNHTNIVAVYDFGITREGHLYLVMEWVEGPTIHELIQKGTIPVRKVANLAMQLCDALSYAHGHKILHRDIKPGNIMVNQDDQVKVADFGLARPITGEAEENPYGTPDYAAPEIMDKRGVDQRVDIFAAGIVLYEMLTGRVPRQPRRSVTDYAPVSAHWDEIITKATHPNVDLRYADVREFRTGIMMAISPASPPPPVAEIDVPVAHAAAAGSMKWVAAVVAVVLIGVVTFFTMGSDEKGKKPKKSRESMEVAAAGDAKPKNDKKADDEPKSKGKAKSDDKATTAVAKAPDAPPPAPETAPVVKPKKNAVVVAPQPEPMTPAPPSPVATPSDILKTLEEKDPEIVGLIVGFSAEWDANPEVNTTPARKDLAGKYIPALQRSLSGMAPEQRDHVLTEISQVANDKQLRDPNEAWPAALTQLRKTYEAQVNEIEGRAENAEASVLAAQTAAVSDLAQRRAAAGDDAGAKRAELVARALKNIRGKPSLEAIREAGGKL